MTEKEEFSKLTSIKECPICGGELNKGYIIPPRGIGWNTKKHKIWFRSANQLIPYESWTIQNPPALRCKKCKIVIFDYEKWKGISHE